MEENKINFSEEEKMSQQDKAVEASKEAVKKDAQGLWQSIKTFFSDLLDFREDTDKDATLVSIKGDISFKGATSWILICSIFVASVGLNANSTAVVIGAMLISPLMGPILGVGLSLAINDVDTLKRSLTNLLIMIALSLITAFLFFKFFPLSEDTSELLGRVKPDIRDVLIAFFGGLALIIAKTKRGTIASAIFGVAIATALMPPLCTAGYGLAKGNFPYFFGAMYLFTINTIFIALATFVVVKILGFPMLKYVNSAKRKRTSRIATIVAIIVMIPATITFIDVWQQSNFESAARAFVNKELDALPHADFIKSNAIFTYDSKKGEQSVLELN
ncbi:MAG: TIGR00341 family protein, partial [Gelidibacter sp.]